MKPKVTLKKDQPVTLVLNKQFGQGETDYGAWFGYDVSVNGDEATLFADEQLHPQIEHLVGQKVTITKTGGKGDVSYTVKIVGVAASTQPAGTPRVTDRDRLILRQVALKGGVQVVCDRPDLFPKENVKSVSAVITGVSDALLAWLENDDEEGLPESDLQEET